MVHVFYPHEFCYVLRKFSVKLQLRRIYLIKRTLVPLNTNVREEQQSRHAFSGTTTFSNIIFSCENINFHLKNDGMSVFASLFRFNTFLSVERVHETTNEASSIAVPTQHVFLSSAKKSQSIQIRLYA